MSDVSELFQRISHPTRVRILKLLEQSPVSFSQLKSNLSIESSGNLDHHLKKLGDLIMLDSNGVYGITDTGREATRAIRSIESGLVIKHAYPAPQSRRLLGVLLMLVAIFILAVTFAVIGILPMNMTVQQYVGLLGGLIGSIVGMLGAALGLRGAIMMDSRSGLRITYFPSKNDPWGLRDWFVNLFFFGSYLTLLFLLVYAQISFPHFLYKPLWFAASIFALSTLNISSIVASYRIVEKANRRIEQSVQP